MAAIPASTESVTDPGLGLAGEVSTKPVFFGYSELGTANAYKEYSDINALVSERGQGPTVELAAHTLATAGGPIGFVTSTCTVAASNSAVVKSGAGPTMTVAGTATNDYSVRVEVVAGGILGTGTFKYCLDDFVGSEAANRTYSSVLVIPSGGTYLLPGTGITLTFPAGTYVAGEVYTFTTECASMNAANIATAMAAINATPKNWRFAVAVVSQGNGDPTTCAGLAAALQSQLNTMAVASKYRSGMIAACADDADPESDFSGLVANRLLIDYGTVRYISPKPFIGFGYHHGVGTGVYAARAAGSFISTDLKRVKGDGLTNGGAIPNVDRIFKDERVAATGLDDIKLSTLRTWEGKAGFYITQGRIKSADGSDIVYWPYRQVMDVACETVHDKQVDFIGRTVRTNAGTGTIDEREALRFEQEVQDALDAKLSSPRNAEGTPGHVSEVEYQIDRTNNVATTNTVLSNTAIRPRAPIDQAQATLGFTLGFEANGEAQ